MDAQGVVKWKNFEGRREKVRKLVEACEIPYLQPLPKTLDKLWQVPGLYVPGMRAMIMASWIRMFSRPRYWWMAAWPGGSKDMATGYLSLGTLYTASLQR